MYKKILVPMALDHGIADKTLEVARALQAEGGQIVALHVYEAPDGSVAAYLDEDMLRAAYESARTRLEERVAPLDGVTAMMKRGHSSRTIIDVAESEDADCVVMGSHKPGFRDYLLGSTAARVVQHAHCDVHVVRTT